MSEPEAFAPVAVGATNDSPNTVAGWRERSRYKYERYVAAEGVVLPPPVEGWASSARRYEWKDEYGELGPEVPELEKELFGEFSEGTTPPSVDFSNIRSITVDVQGPGTKDKIKPMKTFAEAGLHPAMMKNVALSGFTEPTPIQTACIPAIQGGYDILATAQTGSGKTASFLVPIISRLMGKAKKLAKPRPAKDVPSGTYIAEPLVLIIGPTRELVTQIFDESRRFCYRSMLRPCVVYGGADAKVQRDELSRGCDILIGTPGRLMDFLERGRIVTLKRVKYTVIDEADEMLDMGFEPQLRKLLESSDCNQSDDRHCYMFSATFPKQLRSLAKEFLADEYLFIKVGRVGSSNKDITQTVYYVDEHRKKEALYELLCSAPAARTIIFVNHKRTADALDDFLYNLKLPTTSIHGDRTQREREDAMMAFRSGKCPILIATGVAARGLDIKNVMHIINYDMVTNIDEYIHRIGRTARIGNTGLATTFYNDRNENIAEDLVKVLIEAGQSVPDFLERFRPVGEISWEEPSSDEEKQKPTVGPGGGDTGFATSGAQSAEERFPW